jgi:hypothetical protein
LREIATVLPGRIAFSSQQLARYTTDWEQKNPVSALAAKWNTGLPEDSSRHTGYRLSYTAAHLTKAGLAGVLSLIRRRL